MDFKLRFVIPLCVLVCLFVIECHGALPNGREDVVVSENGWDLDKGPIGSMCVHDRDCWSNECVYDKCADPTHSNGLKKGRIRVIKKRKGYLVGSLNGHLKTFYHNQYYGPCNGCNAPLFQVKYGKKYKVRHENPFPHRENPDNIFAKIDDTGRITFANEDKKSFKFDKKTGLVTFMNQIENERNVIAKLRDTDKQVTLSDEVAAINKIPDSIAGSPSIGVENRVAVENQNRNNGGLNFGDEQYVEKVPAPVGVNVGGEGLSFEDTGSPSTDVQNGGSINIFEDPSSSLINNDNRRGGERIFEEPASPSINNDNRRVGESIFQEPASSGKRGANNIFGTPDSASRGTENRGGSNIYRSSQSTGMDNRDGINNFGAAGPSTIDNRAGINSFGVSGPASIRNENRGNTFGASGLMENGIIAKVGDTGGISFTNNEGQDISQFVKFVYDPTKLRISHNGNKLKTGNNGFNNGFR